MENRRLILLDLHHRASNPNPEEMGKLSFQLFFFLFLVLMPGPGPPGLRGTAELAARSRARFVLLLFKTP